MDNINEVEDDRKVVLAVDDEEAILDLLKFNIEKEGFKFISANNGEDAVNLAKEGKPDIIILDVMLPKMDGLTACKKIRQANINVPIIMLSARGEEIDKIVGLEIGADDYMTKPFSTRELLARIKANLRKSEAADNASSSNKRDNKIVVNDLILDLDKFEANVKGERINDLTRREFEVLKYLAERPGQVVTREDLLEKVWGYEYYGDIRTVDVTVRRIREKIEKNTANPKILITKRGVGYYILIKAISKSILEGHKKLKNYHFKLILIFYIISVIVLFALGFCVSFAFRGAPNSKEITMRTFSFTFVAIAILGIISIITAFVSYKRLVEPMSKMLRSANPIKKLDYLETDSNDDLNDVISGLRQDLLAANTQKLQTDTILKHMTDGVIAFNMDGNVTYINPAAIKMLELKDSDDTFDKIFSKYDDINMEKIIYLENWTSSEKKIENKQGTMNLFFVPFKDELNRPTGVMVVVQDITEHVKLNEMRKEFVADVSHELKTPLTSIKGFSETLLDGVDDKETERHFLEIINDNADRMEKLVQDLLTLSKYDSQKATHNKTEFDLGELAKRCAEKFEIEVKKKHQHLECLVTADVPNVYADIDGIERVIINIISNSVKYTPDGGRIDVYVGFVHNDAYVKIKDTGIGIPKKDIEEDRVFDRFYRVDKARARKTGGTGLGLSIAKEIIDQNDGSIKINSELGKGTEVIIKIPVSKKEKAN